MIPNTDVALTRCNRVLFTALGGLSVLVAATFTNLSSGTVPAPAPTPAPTAQQTAMDTHLRPSLTTEPDLPTIIPIAKPDDLLATVQHAVVEASEMQCLTEAVYYEARGETRDGQRAVAEVVARRARDPRYPDSICGVVYQNAKSAGCQFSFACDGEANGKHEPHAWKQAAEVAAYEIAGPGLADDITGGATHFHAVAVNPSWSRRFLRTVQIGNHIFYRQPGRSYEARDLRGASS